MSALWRAIVSIEQPSALSLVSQPMIMHHSHLLLTVGRKSDASRHGWFLEPTPSAPLLWEHCRWRFTQVTGGVSLPASSPSSLSFKHLISPHRPRANRTPESPKWQHSKKVLYGNPPESPLWQHTKKVLYMANHSGSYVQILSRPLDPQGR